MLDNMTSDVVKQYIIYGWCHPVQEIGTHEFPTMTKCTTQDYTTNKIVPTTLLPTIKKRSAPYPKPNQTPPTTKNYSPSYGTLTFLSGSFLLTIVLAAQPISRQDLFNMLKEESLPSTIALTPPQPYTYPDDTRRK